MDMKSKNKKDNLSLPNTKHSLNSKLKSADGENNFYENIVNTVREPLLILDKDLRVVKANQSFFDFFKVNPDETIGTLIYNLGNDQWDIPKLRELLETILPEKTIFNGFEVEHIFSTIGKRFMLLNAQQIERAFGKEKVILLAIEDITERKKIEDGLEKTRKELVIIKKSADEVSKFAENIINTVREPLLLLDKKLRVVKASRSFFDFFKVSSDETIGTLIYNLGNQQWDIPKLRELLETILPEKTTFDNYEVEHDFSTIGKRIMLLNARQIERAFGKEKVILLAIEDITLRKREEKLLRDKNRLTGEYLDILFDLARTPIVIWDSSLIINRFNLEFQILSGYESSEMIGKPIKTLFPGDRANSFIDLLKNHLSDKNSEAFEIDILTKDKSIKTVLWNSTGIFDNEDKNIVATMAQDITERKQTSEKLAYLETSYRILFESAQDGILILDAETGKIIDANPFLCELLDYSKENFVDKELWQIGFFEDIAANKEKFLELQKNGYVRYEDLPLETANGRTINVEFVSYLYSVNNHKVIQCNIRDNTIGKHNKDMLLKLSRAVEQSPVSIIITDTGGDIEYINPKVTEITGYQFAEVIGKNPRIFSSGKKSKSEYKELWEAISSGKVWRGEFHNKKKNGELYWELASISPIINQKGIITNYLAVKEDITERKRAAEELLKAKEKAEESDKLKTEFLAQMSHEIRTPINVLLGYIEYLDDLYGEPKVPEAVDCFDGINIASHRIIRTIDLVLNAAELQTGTYQAKFIKIDLDTEILHKLYKERFLSASQRGLELVYNCELNDPKIFADDYSTTQIFVNLIDNAIKYTRKGKIEILLTKNRNGNIVVEIKDTGIGIAKEFLPRLFDAFAQEEQGYTRSFEGNGLGLALVKRYCEINNALLEVESEKNVGSTFRVIFNN